MNHLIAVALAVLVAFTAVAAAPVIEPEKVIDSLEAQAAFFDAPVEGIIEGVVLEVYEEEHSVLLVSEKHGEVIATFAEDEILPTVEEHVRLFTTGTMTMSLPGIVNVIGWGSIPNELAK